MLCILLTKFCFAKLASKNSRCECQAANVLMHSQSKPYFEEIFDEKQGQRKGKNPHGAGSVRSCADGKTKTQARAVCLAE